MLFCHIISFRTAFRHAASALAFACGVAALSAQPQPAEPQRAMSLVQLAELPRLFDPQLSPDGKSVIYMLGTADWTAGRLAFHLWRQTTSGGAPVALTPGSTGDVPGSNRWSPDGSSILFGRAGQLMLMPATGGEPRAVTRHATAVSFPAWSPDGATIYFLAADAVSAAERERDRRKDDVYAFEENGRLRQLWSVSIATGAEKQLTADNLSVASFRVSGNGRTIVLERVPTPLADDSHKGEVWTLDAGGGNLRQLTHNDVEESQPELSPDGSQILFLAETNEKFEQVLQPESIRDARDRGNAKASHSRFSVRGRSGELGARRQVHSGRGQHGRPRRDLPVRPRIEAGETIDRRPSFHPTRLAGRPGRRKDGVSDRRAVAVRRRMDAADSERTVAGHHRASARDRRLRHARDEIRDASSGKSLVEERGRHDDRRPAVLSGRLRGGHALSAGRPDARWTRRVRQVRRGTGTAAQLLPGPHRQGLVRVPAQLSRQHRLRQRVPSKRPQRRLLQAHAARRHDRRRHADQAGPGRSRSAGGHGLERRRPSDEQARDDDGPVQGGVSRCERGELDLDVPRKPTRATTAPSGLAARRISRTRRSRRTGTARR